MKNEEKIILYLDNQLSDEEKIDFEKEINESSELKAKVDEYKSLFGMMELSEEPEIDNNYFTKIIPQFRKKLEKEESRNYIPAYAFNFIAMIIVIIFSYFLFINDEKNVIDFTDLNTIEFENAESYYPGYYNPAEIEYYGLTDEIPDSVIENQIKNELEIDIEDTEYFYSYLSDYNDLLTGVTDQEAEKVYQELLNRNYF